MQNPALCFLLFVKYTSCEQTALCSWWEQNAGMGASFTVLILLCVCIDAERKLQWDSMEKTMIRLAAEHCGGYSARVQTQVIAPSAFSSTVWQSTWHLSGQSFAIKNMEWPVNWLSTLRDKFMPKMKFQKCICGLWKFTWLSIYGAYFRSVSEE